MKFPENLRVRTVWLGLLALLLAIGCSQVVTEPSPTTPDNVYELHELPETLKVRVEEGSNPASVELALTNAGTCDLDFFIDVFTVDGADWLVVSPPTGTLPPGMSGVPDLPVTVDLIVDFPVLESGLTPGTYTGSIVITGTCTTTGQDAIGSPMRISVNLTVTSASATIIVDQDAIEVDTSILENFWATTANQPAARTGHSAVWTGREMIVWGGSNTLDAADALASGAQYSDLIDSWQSTGLAANTPDARLDHSAVWTGQTMIVFGGTLDDASIANTGAVYDPQARIWTVLPSALAPPLTGHVAVWAGDKMIVWGGAPSPVGATFDPVLGDWTTMDPAGMPQCQTASAVWTGQEMIVWGDGADGGAYDPVLDTWRPIGGDGVIDYRASHSAIWTGREMIVWGGLEEGIPAGTGARYDPTADTWTPISMVDAPAPRGEHRAVWTGHEMIVWGGTDYMGGDAGPGGFYNPHTDTWNPMEMQDEPGPRTGHTAVWTGQQMIVWGGLDPANSTLDTGGLFR